MLYEVYRPTRWAEVIDQEKAMARIEQLRRHGLAGRT